jgi:Domain of unknown function (DUF4388)
VSLEGTLETIALPDVLALLSVTTKTGELQVESSGGGGSVWLDDGRVAGYDVGSQKSPVDALFALLRLTEGSFRFRAGTEPLNTIDPEEVAPLLEQAEARLEEWPAIAAVVPSLASRLHLQASVDDEVHLTPAQWSLVASIGDSRSVGDVLTAQDLGEFDGSKAVKELVESHLVWVEPIEQPVAVDLSPAELKPDTSGQDGEVTTWFGANGPGPADLTDFAGSGDAVEMADAANLAEIPDVAEVGELTNLSEVWNDEIGDVESTLVTSGIDETGVEDPADTAQPVNRGLLLKFLGSARS